jgi:hypothetical protein
MNALGIARLFGLHHPLSWNLNSTPDDTSTSLYMCLGVGWPEAIRRTEALDTDALLAFQAG